MDGARAGVLYRDYPDVSAPPANVLKDLSKALGLNWYKLVAEHGSSGHANKRP